MKASARLWRYKVVFGLLLLAVAGLGARLVLLVRQGDCEMAGKAVRQQRMVIPLPGRPGSIFARSSRRYVPLAISRQVPSCYADPFLLADDDLDDVAIAVGDALSMDPREVQSKLLARRRGRFAWLKRQISQQEAAAIRALSIRAVGVTHEWRRAYPNNQLAATVVGFRRLDGEPGGGLELTQQKYLAGRPGRRVVLADAFRRPIWPLPTESYPPQDGAMVFLHLDAIIQGYLQEAVAAAVEKFSAKWGTGVVVNPRTGEVLAMCSVPTFNPNEFNTIEASSRTNRTVCVPFEPGSVFKPIIAAAAVESGAVSYETEIFCENGRYRAHRGGWIGDHDKSYGYLSVADGVVFSSNICLAKIGEKLGNGGLYRTVRRFGFGRRTGVELSGESGGIVRPLRRWNGYSLRRVPFGQEISVTALQLTMAFSSLANGGLLLEPRLVARITDADGRTLYSSKRQVVRRVLSPQVAAQTLAVLQQVVERGTGRRCRLRQWTSFGKTGTAQIPGPGGYVEGAYVSAFVGGAPVRRPRIMCLIAVYWPDASKGYYGSVVAAPGVKEVLQRSLRYLNVPPDRGGNATAGTRGLVMGRR